ncbi:hypothetical protein HY993_02860 [Candidatus Micrarchaeota archaeon]|nr:hypothetical protein [Candidatus Micrarchaeota archaeon]
MRKTRSLFFLIVIALATLVYAAVDSREDSAQIVSFAYSNGTTFEALKYNRVMESPGLVYPPQSYSLPIPLNAENLLVTEKTVDPVLKNLGAQVQGKADYSLASFTTMQQVNYGDDYPVYLTYFEKRNPSRLEKEFTFSRVLFINSLVKKTVFEVNLPPASVLISAKPAYVVSGSKITFVVTDSTPVEVKVVYSDSNYSTNADEPVSSMHYSINSPGENTGYFTGLLAKADSGFDWLKKLRNESNGMDKYELELFENTAFDFATGYYSQGKISLKQSSVLKSESEALATIYHETSHAVNSEYYEDKNPSSSWFEEGLAEFLSQKTLEKQGLDYSRLSRYEQIANSCSQSDLAFIESWKKNCTRCNYQKIVQCGSTSLDEDTLGYVYSTTILNQITRKYGVDSIPKVLRLLRENKIKLLEDNKLFNNQLNYLLYEASNRSDENILRPYYINADSFSDSLKALENATGRIKFLEETTPSNFSNEKALRDAAKKIFLRGNYSRAQDELVLVNKLVDELEKTRLNTLMELINSSSRISADETKFGKQFFSKTREVFSSSNASYWRGDYNNSMEEAGNALEQASRTIELINEFRLKQENLENSIELASKEFGEVHFRQSGENLAGIKSVFELGNAEEGLVKIINETTDFEGVVIRVNSTNELVKQSRESAGAENQLVYGLFLGQANELVEKASSSFKQGDLAQSQAYSAQVQPAVEGAKATANLAYAIILLAGFAYSLRKKLMKTAKKLLKKRK